jgi:CRISPR/Cas system-associated exonuclease Cas4 (RecB family)
MRTIRASEIGAYLFCQRAWWYRIQGIEPENRDEMNAGTELHYRHSRLVLLSGCIRVLAYGLLLAALVLAAVYVTGRFL